MTSRSVLTGGRTPETASDAWRTPDDVLDPVRAYGRIVTDPCASDDQSHWYALDNMPRPVGTNLHPPVDGKQCKCNDCTHARRLRKTSGGIAADWRGLTFVNPEFSNAEEWVDACIRNAAGECSVILLLPARIGSAWYRTASAHADAVGEWKGRIKFVGAPCPAMFPTVLFGFNVSWRRFASAFGGVADITVPIGRCAA